SNLCGNVYLLCSILDGFSRFLVHWDLRESMKEVDIELILQRAKEKYPEARPRIISDNGPQFIARDFKEFIRISGMTHVRTSPYYPQSNGKLERWHQSVKRECMRPLTPLTLEDARRLLQRYVDYYNCASYYPPGYVVENSKPSCSAVGIAGYRLPRRTRSTKLFAVSVCSARRLRTQGLSGRG